MRESESHDFYFIIYNRAQDMGMYAVPFWKDKPGAQSKKEAQQQVRKMSRKMKLGQILVLNGEKELQLLVEMMERSLTNPQPISMDDAH
jgi:hypothetical protein